MLEAEVRAEKVANPALEAVELRVGVLADRDEEGHPQVVAHDRARELEGEGPLAVLVGVVEEVLLELVEHEQQLAARRLVIAGREGDGALVKAAEPLGEQHLQARRERRRRGRELAELVAHGRFDRVGERPQRVVPPAGADDEHGFRHPALLDRRARAGGEVGDESGPHERALADPARAVEERQPGREDARRQQAPLALAAEVEGRVPLSERRKSDVRRLWQARHPQAATACRRDSSSVTYSSSGMSSTSTPRTRQSSCSISLGPF